MHVQEALQIQSDDPYFLYTVETQDDYNAKLKQVEQETGPSNNFNTYYSKIPIVTIEGLKQVQGINSVFLDKKDQVPAVLSMFVKAGKEAILVARDETKGPMVETAKKIGIPVVQNGHVAQLFEKQWYYSAH